jgi:SNF2 family DNA or RNA helicase
MENNLGEIWSLFHFLMPGFLGSQKRFTELFRKPIEKQGDPEAMFQLRARVTPFMLRRTKALVSMWPPPMQLRCPAAGANTRQSPENYEYKYTVPKRKTRTIRWGVKVVSIFCMH